MLATTEKQWKKATFGRDPGENRTKKKGVFATHLLIAAPSLSSDRLTMTQQTLLAGCWQPTLVIPLYSFASLIL